MTQTKTADVAITETTAEDTLETQGIDWDEVKENSRKGLNYLGIGTSFVGNKLSQLGEYLKSV